MIVDEGLRTCKTVNIGKQMWRNSDKRINKQVQWKEKLRYLTKIIKIEKIKCKEKVTGVKRNKDKKTSKRRKEKKLKKQTNKV